METDARFELSGMSRWKVQEDGFEGRGIRIVGGSQVT
jgi:hypothetical protein